MMAIARVPEPFPLTDIEIAKMRRRHLRKVLSIEASVYPRPWSASLFLSELAQRSTRSYIVARHEGEVIGYGGLMFTGLEAHITNIAVDPGFHARKVGTRLLLALVTEAIARGAETISLEVRVSNRAAQAMYEKFGFAVIGTRKGYYIETNEDAYLMAIEDARSTEHRLLLSRIRDEINAFQDGAPRDD